MTRTLIEEQLQELFADQAQMLDSLEHAAPSEFLADRVPSSVRAGSRGRVGFMAAAAAAVLLVGVATRAGLTNGESDLDAVSEPAVTTAAWFADPNGDMAFILQQVETEIDRCMEQVGHPAWAPNTTTYFDHELPAFETSGGQVVGYAGIYANRFGPEPSAGAAEVEALLGSGDESLSVDLGDGTGRDLGGCQGEGYRAVLTEDEIPEFLIAEALLLNLGSAYRRVALENTSTLADWSGCLASSGLSIQDPFRVGFSISAEAERVVASADAACRESHQLVQSYSTGRTAADTADFGEWAPDVGTAAAEIAVFAARTRDRIESTGD